MRSLSSAIELIGRKLRGSRPDPREEKAAPAAPLQEPWSACYAPHSSMYFDQFGKVRACCQNTGLYLGDVSEQTIREIWDSADAEHLRSALEKNDYSAGCEFCEWQVREGNESILFARQFDELMPEDRRPRWPRQMEFSLTNTCNLACVMCNGDWSSTIRAKRENKAPIPRAYGDEFFEQLEDFLPHLDEVEFLGGEPFLGEEPLRVMEMLGELSNPPRTTITTNGTVFTERVQRILQLIEPSIVISLDGANANTYEAIRIGANFDKVIANLNQFYEQLGPLKVSLTHCLMTTNWHEFADLLHLAEERKLFVGINVVRFPAEASLYQLDPERLAKVVETMQSTSVTLTGQRLEVWNGHLAALAHRLETISAPNKDLGPVHGLPGAGWVTEVSIAPRDEPLPAGEPYADSPLSERDIASLRDSLASDTDSELLELLAEDDVVIEVTSPGSWEWLHASSWVGLNIADLTGEIERRLGATVSAVPLEPDNKLADRFAVTIDLVSGRRELTAAFFRGPGKRNTGALLSLQ